MKWDTAHCSYSDRPASLSSALGPPTKYGSGAMRKLSFADGREASFASSRANKPAVPCRARDGASPLFASSSTGIEIQDAASRAASKGVITRAQNSEEGMKRHKTRHQKCVRPRTRGARTSGVTHSSWPSLMRRLPCDYCLTLSNNICIGTV
jgi:hypothetical protein